MAWHRALKQQSKRRDEGNNSSQEIANPPHEIAEAHILL